MSEVVIGRGVSRLGPGADNGGARRRAAVVLASAALLLAACAKAPGGLQRATAPAHATGDVPIAGPVAGAAAEAHGGHDGHAQGRAARSRAR